MKKKIERKNSWQVSTATLPQLRYLAPTAVPYVPLSAPLKPINHYYHTMLSTVSSYLWGEEGTTDLPGSGNNDAKDVSRPKSMITEIHSRRSVQSQLRRVHIEMWRENVRQLKQLRESKNDTIELKGGGIMKRLEHTETKKQLELKDKKEQDLLILKSNKKTEILHSSVDEVENDYVLLFCPN